MRDETHDGSVFGLWLRRRRRQLGWTQTKLAAAVGCSVATVRKLEADERHPSERVALALAAALDVPEDERTAFVRFARAGWADRPPESPEPEMDRPWLGAEARTPAEDDPAVAGPGPGAETPFADDASGPVELRPRLPDATLHPPRLVGREALWEEMERNWRAGRHIFLRGPGGIGKTRLMIDFAESKGTFVVGPGHPGDHVAPFLTIRRLFRRMFERWPEARSELAPWAKAELSRYLPELHVRQLAPFMDETERLRFFEAQLQLTLLLAQKVSMVLGDDLQFYDRSSFEVQSWVTGQIVRRRLSTARSIAAYRPNEMPDDYVRGVDELVRGGASTVVDVTPLSEAAVADLLRVLFVPPDVFPASEAVVLTGGNPMHVIEAVKSWWETRVLPASERPADAIRIGAPRAIQECLHRLDPGDRWLAQALAVMQEATTSDLLADVLGESSWQVAERLGRLESANIVRNVRFVHDLLAEGALESLSAPERRLLHARAADALIRSAAEPALVAHHLEQAGRTDEALAWRLDAAERALEQGSRIEARRWLAWVLERAPDRKATAARAGVLLGHAWRSADADAAEGAFSRALAGARQAASPALEARALAGLAQIGALRGRDAEVRVHEGAASELAGALPAAERARLLLDLSEVRWAIGDFGESEERIAEAVRLDPEQPRYRLALAHAHWHRGRFRDAIEELHKVLRGHPESARLTPVLLDLGQNHRALGELEPAVHWLERALEVWRDSGDLLTEARVREALGAAYTGRGALAAADWELVGAERLYRRHGADARLVGVAPKRAYVRLLAGDAATALELCELEPAIDLDGNRYRHCEVLAVRGVALARLGRHGEGREATDAAVALADAAGHPLTQTTALRCRAEAAIAAGDDVTVRTAAAMLLELTRRHGMREQEAWAHALAGDAEDGATARQHARTAARLASEQGYLPVGARAAERLARLGEAGMLERATALRQRMLASPLPAVGVGPDDLASSG